MASEKATYLHGHHATVTTSHARRTASNSAGFLLPHLRPTDHILDLGCGPGSITCDLAALVPSGNIIGGDAVASVLDQARALASERGLANITFEALDGNALPYADGTFDVVFCHQVLQHVKDPVGVLREMRRICKKGGLVAAREVDYKSFSWFPEPRLIDRWGSLYQQIARASGGEPNAGRFLRSWALAAGFARDAVTFSWASWLYQGEDARIWGDSWHGRVVHSGFADSAKRENLSEQAELEEISRAWKEWGENPDSFIAIPNGEILCRVP
ncbi:ubiE/COQ5 methyltransferase [Xylariaceae sp. FL0016]|nr:ubiE/COQ5 methyltransferase [Xylariaceae sp. FL0016]